MPPRETFPSVSKRPGGGAGSVPGGGNASLVPTPFWQFGVALAFEALFCSSLQLRQQEVILLLADGSCQTLGTESQQRTLFGQVCPVRPLLTSALPPVSAGERPGPYQRLLSTHQALDWPGRGSGDTDASLGWVPQRDHPGGNTG